jgi:hypothetical protein
MDCGVPAPLSAIVSVPFVGPYAAGWKATLTLQLVPALRDAGQLFVWLKAPMVAIE